MVLSWFDPSVDNFPGFIKMLSGRGYQVAGGNTMDLATLRSPPAQPIGVLYIFTHGLFDFVPSQPMPSQDPANAGAATTPLVFGLATTMPTNVTQAQLSAADWAALQADLNAQPPRLTPGNFAAASRSASGGIVEGATAGFFCATVAFFQHYWGPSTFAQNSLVFVNGCFSAQDDFQNACVAAGAGLVLGWTMPVRLLDAANTANFVFDRMLGANCQNPLCFPEPQERWQRQPAGHVDREFPGYRHGCHPVAVGERPCRAADPEHRLRRRQRNHEPGLYQRLVWFHRRHRQDA